MDERDESPGLFPNIATKKEVMSIHYKNSISPNYNRRGEDKTPNLPATIQKL